ncbi:MAG TPA: putative glycoside hydrolase [Candidatus Limnocylindria bacterium]
MPGRRREPASAAEIGRSQLGYPVASAHPAKRLALPRKEPVLTLDRHLRPAAVLMALALLLTACGDSLPFLPSTAPTPQQPREVAIALVDRHTGEPVAGASVAAGDANGTSDAGGTVTLSALRGAQVNVEAAGYDAAAATVPDEGDLRVELRSNVLTGTVTDATGSPVSGARVFVDGSQAVVRTDEKGRYRLGGVPADGTLVVKMPGFRLATLTLADQAGLDVALQPFVARGLYAPSAVFEAPGRLDQMLDLIDRTEVNAMVIDVKETDGNLYWSTELPAAVKAGAVMDHPLFDLAELLPKLKERGIYTIARMVVMKDNTVGRSRPELAVRNSATGQPWTDFRGGVWLDPYNPGVAEYIAALAGDLADKGFDEVQLDYVRFYSDGDYSVAQTNLPNMQSFRLPAIRRLFRLVGERLAAEKTFFAADVFPISFIAPDDQGIGQRPEVIMPYVDYFCPMVYPSHYGPGTFGIAQPNEHPYEIIDQTLEIMNEQKQGLPMVIRPWIQDFGYGSFRAYTANDVRAEMKALADNQAQGWMIWNAQARFTQAALGPPRDGEDAGPMTSGSPAASPAASPGS